MNRESSALATRYFFHNRLDLAGWISIMVEPLLCINVPVVGGPNDWGIYEQQ